MSPDGKPAAVIRSAEYWSADAKMPDDQLRRIGDSVMEINRSQVLPPGTPVEVRLKLKAPARAWQG